MIRSRSKEIIVGTRGSPLALWQADFVKEKLRALDPSRTITLKIIKTTGDKIDDRPLFNVGGKGLFLKEIEEELLAGTIDLAVHSMKDVPVELPAGLLMVSLCKREDPRDAFLSEKYSSLVELPNGSVVGTSSLRRQSQLKNLRPDLQVVSLRGNVETRLRKMKEGVCEATFLATAGLNRLGLASHIREKLSPATMLPAVGQGAIGIEVLEKNKEVVELARLLNDEETSLCVTAERAFLRVTQGGCQAPIAALAEKKGEQLTLTALVGLPDGTKIVKKSATGPAWEGERLGEGLGKKILEEGGREILKECMK